MNNDARKKINIINQNFKVSKVQNRYFKTRCKF